VPIALLFAVLVFACIALPLLRRLNASNALPHGLSRTAYLVVAAVLILGLMVLPPHDVLFPGLVVAAGLLLMYLRMWVREFLFLMGLSDEDFPGRFDKAIWATVMVAFGPLGLWTFHRYRAAQWPAPAVDDAMSRAGKPATAHDWF
jgi:hypothetical protein